MNIKLMARSIFYICIYMHDKMTKYFERVVHRIRCIMYDKEISKENKSLSYYVHYIKYIMSCKMCNLLFSIKYYLLKLYYSSKICFEKMNHNNINKNEFKVMLLKAINDKDIFKILLLFEIKKYSDMRDTHGEYKRIIIKIVKLSSYDDACGMLCIKYMLEAIPNINHDMIDAIHEYNDQLKISNFHKLRLTDYVLDYIDDKLSLQVFNNVIIDRINSVFYNTVDAIVNKYKKYISNMRDCDGNTLLHYACATKNINFIKIIIEHDKNIIDVKNDHGHTPLFYASFFGYIDIVKILLNHGCNIE